VQDMGEILPLGYASVRMTRLDDSQKTVAARMALPKA
jgi:hypothetical protein